MTSPLDPEQLELYDAPFVYRNGYIYDANGHMVTDDNSPDSINDQLRIVLRIRGWERIGRMKNAETLQDKIGHHIAAAMTEYWERNKS